MNYQLSSLDTKLDKAMTTEQFNEIVGAILEGKYSWACVLILRFSGYNPLHYIPYRTYNRLVKDHCQTKKQYSKNILAARGNSSSKIPALVAQK